MLARSRSAIVLYFCAALLPFSRSAWGILLYSTPTRNGTPDSSSIAYPAWQLESQPGGLLGTPFADQYFLTAAHTLIGADVDHRRRIIAGQDPAPNLSSASIVFQGQTYAVDSSYAFGGAQYDANSDLAILKIKQVFPTYAHLYAASDEASRQMVVIGRGTQRGADIVVNSQLRGWYAGPDDGMQSWGQNTVSGISGRGIGWGDSLAFKFDSADNEQTCTLSTGDSGGGLFIQSAGQWQLAGVNFSVDGFFSLTGPPDTSPFIGAIFDARALWEQTLDWTYHLDSGPLLPQSAYATRISSNLAFINASIPEPGALALLIPAAALLGLRRRPD